MGEVVSYRDAPVLFYLEGQVDEERVIVLIRVQLSRIPNASKDSFRTISEKKIICKTLPSLLF